MLSTRFTFTVFPYIIAACLSSSGFAKGLDTLQAGSDKPQAGEPDATDEQETPNGDKVPGVTPAPTQPPVQTQAGTETEKFYLATSFSWISLSGSKGDWTTGATGDLEAGFRLASITKKIDLFGTFRYRPVEAIISQDERQYRGIVETYLFGTKARLGLNNKLSVNASAEVGTSQTHLNSNDSLPTVDQSLEKSGVDLNLGGGVSYLVLEKFAVGGKVIVGSGAYKSVQFGIDLRLML